MMFHYAVDSVSVEDWTAYSQADQVSLYAWVYHLLNSSQSSSGYEEPGLILQSILIS